MQSLIFFALSLLLLRLYEGAQSWRVFKATDLKTRSQKLNAAHGGKRSKSDRVMKLQEDTSDPSTNSSGAPYNYLIQSFFSNDKNCSSAPDYQFSSPLDRCVSVYDDSSSYRYVLHNYGDSVALDYHYYSSSPNCSGNSEGCSQETSGYWGCSGFSEKPLGCLENSYDEGSTQLLLSSTDLPSNYEEFPSNYEEFCLAGNCNYDFFGDLDSPANMTQSFNRLKERSKCPRAAGGDVMNIQATFVVTTFRSGLDDVWMHIEANYTDTSYFEGSSVYVTAKFVDSTRRLKHNVGFLKWSLTQSVQQFGYIDFRARFPDDFKMNVNSIRVKIVQFKANQKHTLDCRNYDLPETIRGFPDIEEGKTTPGCLPDCPNPWIPGYDFYAEEMHVPEIYSKEECMEACKAMDGYNIVNIYNHCIHANNFCNCQKGAISYQHFNETLTHSTDPNPFWINCYLD